MKRRNFLQAVGQAFVGVAFLGVSGLKLDPVTRELPKVKRQVMGYVLETHKTPDGGREMWWVKHELDEFNFLHKSTATWQEALGP